jgi:hypothetical protein
VHSLPRSSVHVDEKREEERARGSERERNAFRRDTIEEQETPDPCGDRQHIPSEEQRGDAENGEQHRPVAPRPQE